MHQQQVIFESSPAYIIVCAILALGIAFLLYRWNTAFPWTKNWNRLLFAFRFILAFLLMFLLLGPIVKQVNNLFEKPLAVILFDNSSSLREANDTTVLNQVVQKLKASKEKLEDQGYDVRISDLDNETEDPKFNANMSDRANALRKISSRYEGKKIESVVSALHFVRAFEHGGFELEIPRLALRAGDCRRRAQFSRTRPVHHQTRHHAHHHFLDVCREGKARVGQRTLYGDAFNRRSPILISGGNRRPVQHCEQNEVLQARLSGKLWQL